MRLLLAALTRDQARQAAQEELSRREYADARPPLLLRLLGRALRALGRLLDGAAGSLGGGPVARALLVVLVVAAVAVLLVRLQPPGGRGGPRAVLADAPQRSARQHRDAAGQLAAQGHWSEAVRERLRAVVRELEAGGVLDPRPSRTAGEVARDAGAAVPALADDLSHAARLFDEVWYGGRTASAETYRALVEVDRRAAAALGVRA